MWQTLGFAKKVKAAPPKALHTPAFSEEIKRESGDGENKN